MRDFNSQYGMVRPLVLSVHFWRAMIFPERQLFRFVLPTAAGLVPVRIICTFYVLTLLCGWTERDLKRVHQRK